MRVKPHGQAVGHVTCAGGVAEIKRHCALRGAQTRGSLRALRADPLGSTDDEVRVGAQPPLVAVV